MVLKNILIGLLLLMFSLVSSLHASPADQSKEQKVETLVQEAVDLVKDKGEAAFPEFRKKGSTWTGSDHYIFIFDEKGNELVNGGFPELEGENLWDRKDTSGRYVIQEEVSLVKAKGSGWIDVLWPKPGQTKEINCRVFLKGVTVDGNLLIIGAPLYLE
jgi:cytochrome c